MRKKIEDLTLLFLCVFPLYFVSGFLCLHHGIMASWYRLCRLSKVWRSTRGIGLVEWTTQFHLLAWDLSNGLSMNQSSSSSPA